MQTNRPTTSYVANNHNIVFDAHPRNISPLKSNSPITMQRPVTYNPTSNSMHKNTNQLIPTNPTIKINFNPMPSSPAHVSRPASNLSPTNRLTKVQFTQSPNPVFVKQPNFSVPP